MRSQNTIATPPGATIKEQLDSRGITQKEFAKRMDMSEKHISKLINGEVSLSQDVALRLESVLGLPASFWNNLETRYKEKMARVEYENSIEADKEIAKKFPYNEIAKLGWVPSTGIALERVMNLRSFFSVAKLEILDNLLIPGIAFRRTEIKSSSNFALAVWAQKARIEAMNAEVDRVNLERLASLVPMFRSMTRQSPELFCSKLIENLSQCGIALVLLPHMQGSCLHGASFLDGKKIVMGLTVRGRDADKFWFSFFHELGHILDGHIGNEVNTVESEGIADMYAANTLIPIVYYRELIDTGDFSEKAILSFADRIDIDPGIVVGRLQKDNIILYNQCNRLKTKYQLLN